VSIKKTKVRRVWVINPSTRVKDSKKPYSRPKAKAEAHKLIKNEE